MIFKNAVSALLSRSIMCYFFSKYNRTGIFNQSEIKNFQNKIYGKFQKICRGRKKTYRNQGKLQKLVELVERYQKVECGICCVPHTKTEAYVWQSAFVLPLELPV